MMIKTASLAGFVLFLCGCTASRSFVHRSLLHSQDGPQAEVGVLSPLPYGTSALEPYIDNDTTTIHHDKHFNTYVVNLRYLVGNNSQLSGFTLAELQGQVGTDLVNGTAATTLRNSGGGAWNHAFFFKHLAPADTPESQFEKAASDDLKSAIDASYGNFSNFQKQFTTAAAGVFGSGFAWLVVTDNNVTITTTPNQNNPLQTAIAATTNTTAGIPVLSIDVWEHAYYLKHQSNRAGWLTNFFAVINWVQVSENYQYAAAGGVPATAPGPMLTLSTT